MISPEIPAELKVRCAAQIANPLSTGDQYDLARALVEATQYAKDCRARMDVLIDAVEVRESVVRSLRGQIEEKK